MSLQPGEGPRGFEKALVLWRRPPVEPGWPMGHSEGEDWAASPAVEIPRCLGSSAAAGSAGLAPTKALVAS